MKVKLKKAIKPIDVQIQRERVSLGINRYLASLRGYARTEAPFRTGTLIRRHFIKNSRPNTLKGSLIVNVFYGIYVAEGTKYIKPNRWLDRAVKKAGSILKFFR